MQKSVSERFRWFSWGQGLGLPPQQGSYWSLDKRAGDLPRLPAEWAKTVAAFQGTAPETFCRPPVVALGSRLAAAAERLAARLAPEGLGSAPGLTLLHGDFKTANLFISSGGGRDARVFGLLCYSGCSA